MNHQQLIARLNAKGLKVTPQRIAVLEAVYQLGGHPTADQIIEVVRLNNPNIATGTVYKILDSFVGIELLQRVKTDKDIMRYDAVLEKHHHLYDAETIKDYFDEELDKIIEDYFHKKRIPDFHIEEIKLQIIGRFSSGQ